MERIYDKKEIADCIARSKYRSVLDSLDLDYYLINYEKGEFVSSPFQSELLFQIVEQGAVDIYFVRDDGTRYSLSGKTADCFLGDMEIFYPRNSSIYAEAAGRLTCISFSVEKHRKTLLENNRFLEMICKSLSAKIGAMTVMDAAPASLTERVISYMKYKCADGTLKGIEQAAFQLHCSARHLQRILNRCEAAGLVRRLGKGTYRLGRGEKIEKTFLKKEEET